jgi:hypothetical protein
VYVDKIVEKPIEIVKIKENLVFKEVVHERVVLREVERVVEKPYETI